LVDAPPSSAGASRKEQAFSTKFTLDLLNMVQQLHGDLEK